jgi:hypothetical protein
MIGIESDVTAYFKIESDASELQSIKLRVTTQAAPNGTIHFWNSFLRPDESSAAGKSRS